MKQKNYNLEIIRLISCIMVIAIHVVNYYCRAYPAIHTGEYCFSLIINIISRISVPCFFMISGALLLGKKDSIEKSLNRAKGMLLKLVFWSVIYYLFNTYITNQSTCNLFNFMTTPAEAHLWYLYVLIPIYIMLPYLQALAAGLDEKMEKAFIIIGFLWLLGVFILPYFKTKFYYALPVFGNQSYIFYFFMGHFIQEYKDKINLKPKKALLISTVCTIIIFFLTITATFRSNSHYDNFLKYGNPLMIVSAVSFFTMIVSLKPESLHLSETVKKKIDKWSLYSFGIYIVHVFLLDFYKINFRASDICAYLAVPILTSLLAIGSFFMVKFLYQTPFGKRVL